MNNFTPKISFLTSHSYYPTSCALPSFFLSSAGGDMSKILISIKYFSYIPLYQDRPTIHQNILWECLGISKPYFAWAYYRWLNYEKNKGWMIMKKPDLIFLRQKLEPFLYRRYDKNNFDVENFLKEILIIFLTELILSFWNGNQKHQSIARLVDSNAHTY